MASDIYPVVRRFLLESGLNRSLKAFDKETSTGDDAEALGLSKKKAKAIGKIELTAACQLMLDASTSSTNGAAPAEVADAEAHRDKKRKRAAEEDAAPVAVAPEEVPASVAEPAPAEEVSAEIAKKKKKKEKHNKEQKASGVPFKRVDEDKWRQTIQDSRLVDNRHQAKQKFGGSVGDTWGGNAAGDLLKVKGKGFRKEMAKKKRASWRGGGEIDQGVNSIKFADSSDDE